MINLNSFLFLDLNTKYNNQQCNNKKLFISSIARIVNRIDGARITMSLVTRIMGSKCKGQLSEIIQTSKSLLTSCLPISRTN